GNMVEGKGGEVALFIKVRDKVSRNIQLLVALAIVKRRVRLIQLNGATLALAIAGESDLASHNLAHHIYRQRWRLDALIRRRRVVCRLGFIGSQDRQAAVLREEVAQQLHMRGSVADRYPLPCHRSNRSVGARGGKIASRCIMGTIKLNTVAGD